MISRINADFRKDFAGLPREIQQRARDTYKLFQANPNHPSLHFKKLPPYENIWSVRISASFRAIGRMHGEVIVWFFIGSHADYDKLLARM